MRREGDREREGGRGELTDKHTTPDRVGLPPLSTDAAVGTFLIGTLGDIGQGQKGAAQRASTGPLAPKRGREGRNGDGAIPDGSEWLA